MSTSSWVQLEEDRLRHDNMYRLLAVWSPAGNVERQEFFAMALANNSKHKKRAPRRTDGKQETDAMVCVSTILLALHTGDNALMAEIDARLLASKREKEAFGCFLTLLLPQLIDALHQGAFAQHRADHGGELAMFCGAAVHAWMCQV